MGHPVTTNPLIIMTINMTVVFIVLISLSFLIRLIHAVDPTKEPEKKEEPAPAPVAQVAPPEPEPVVDEGISPEVIAAISAAITAYGYSGHIHAVHILHHEHTLWSETSHINARNQG